MMREEQKRIGGYQAMATGAERRKAIVLGLVSGIVAFAAVVLDNAGRVLSARVLLFLALIGFVFQMRSVFRWKESKKTEEGRG